MKSRSAQSEQPCFGKLHYHTKQSIMHTPDWRASSNHEVCLSSRWLPSGQPHPGIVNSSGHKPSIQPVL